MQSRFILESPTPSWHLLVTNGPTLLPRCLPTCSAHHPPVDPGTYRLAHSRALPAVALGRSQSVRSLGLIAYSYWTFSDVFEEGGIPGKNTPFHGGFGMINLYDVPKPSMRAFQVLNMLSATEAQATLSGGSPLPASLTVLATHRKSQALQRLCSSDSLCHVATAWWRKTAQRG